MFLDRIFTVAAYREWLFFSRKTFPFAPLINLRWFGKSCCIWLPLALPDKPGNDWTKFAAAAAALSVGYGVHLPLPLPLPLLILASARVPREVFGVVAVVGVVFIVGVVVVLGVVVGVVDIICLMTSAAISRASRITAASLE